MSGPNQRLAAILLLTALGLAGAFAQNVVVTTSMIESALRDAYDGHPSFGIERIIPPGNCPGHFDLKPRMLEEIRSADLFIYHDYQKGIEKRIVDLKAPVRMLAVEQEGSFLIPSNYWQTVRFLRSEISESIPAPSTGIDKDESAVVAEQAAADCGELEKFWRTAAERNGWAGVPVIASALQADFCRWLGFEIAGLLPRSEELTLGKMRELIDSGAVMVVGNMQSGGRSARMLAERMRIPSAILDNFPDTDGEEKSSYRLLAEENLGILERAWNRR